MTENPLSDSPPFVGRQAMLARLQQFLSNTTPQAHALCFVSAEGMGKTALLKHITRLGGDFIGVYVVMNDARLSSERDVLLHVIQRMTDALKNADINPARIPPIDHMASNLREWLIQAYLPEVAKLVRTRRLVLLWDDVHALMDAKNTLRVPRDFATFWRDVLQKFPQIALIASADLHHEAQLQALAPLISTANTERLTRLTADESAAFVRLFAAHASEDTQAHAYALTGGHPRFLRLYSQYLTADATPEDAQDKLYAASHEDFLRMWFRFSRDERIVLTAMAQLAYQDPSAVMTLDAIRDWLIETDYPLDSTTIHTALRGLEYLEVTQHVPQGITWTSTLFYRWLVEHGRLDGDTPATPPNRRLLIGGVLLVLLVLLIVAMVVMSPPPSLTQPAVVATATLGR